MVIDVARICESFFFLNPFVITNVVNRVQNGCKCKTFNWQTVSSRNVIGRLCIIMYS